ncbi:hypothetical protein MMC06_003482 [Schaereria dolodes]|nr:hypothetical protein [Schaereria dolodes]
MSACDKTLTSPIQPSFAFKPDSVETPNVQDLIIKLGLQKHPEGGYFVETDRDPLRIHNPFQLGDIIPQSSQLTNGQDNDSTRSASTTIYYLLTPANPRGVFHRNKGRTIHTLHRGRGRYVIIHADEMQNGGKARIETFVVGHNIQRGERLQWLVEGGKYKASFLLPDAEATEDSEGLLISETVVPGFEFSDHDFMVADTLPGMVTVEQGNELSWLLRAGG